HPSSDGRILPAAPTSFVEKCLERHQAALVTGSPHLASGDLHHLSRHPLTVSPGDQRQLCGPTESPERRLLPLPADAHV
uniref:Si:dkey-95p16.1 n=1 Tax=Astyanax mexicanus TaxID=7994 RepID=A0A3B1KB26_ASTMX